MRRIIPLLAMILLASCAQQRVPVKDFTLVSYNTGNFAKYMDNSMPEAVAFFKSVLANAVCMNELDSCNLRHSEYQLKEVAARMSGLEYYFASAFDYAEGGYGNGIMTRDHIIYSDKITLPKLDGSEQRSVAVVETEKYVLACTHLDHRSEEAQHEQVRIINEWFTKRYAKSRKPVFLCGDMNALPESLTIKMLEECWTRISSTEFTHSTKKPAKCIDYIFFLTAAKKVTVRKSEVANGDEMVQVSDHFPTYVVVDWR